MKSVAGQVFRLTAFPLGVCRPLPTNGGAGETPYRSPTNAPERQDVSGLLLPVEGLQEIGHVVRMLLLLAQDPFEEAAGRGVVLPHEVDHFLVRLDGDPDRKST